MCRNILNQFSTEDSDFSVYVLHVVFHFIFVLSLVNSLLLKYTFRLQK